VLANQGSAFGPPLIGHRELVNGSVGEDGARAGIKCASTGPGSWCDGPVGGRVTKGAPGGMRAVEGSALAPLQPSAQVPGLSAVRRFANVAGTG
jgi:hypothetical protein